MRLRPRREDEDARGVHAVPGLGHQRQAVLVHKDVDAVRRAGVIAAGHRRHERQPMLDGELAAAPLVVHHGGDLAGAAEQCRGQVRPALTQPSEPLHVLVTTRHDEVGFFTGDDGQDPVLECDRVVGHLRRQVNGIEVEQRGLVGRVAGRHQAQRIPTRLQRRHHVRACVPAARKQQQRQQAHRFRWRRACDAFGCSSPRSNMANGSNLMTASASTVLLEEAGADCVSGPCGRQLNGEKIRKLMPMPARRSLCRERRETTQRRAQAGTAE